MLDFFCANPRLNTPSDTLVPAGGSPLANYIMQRFMDSFALWATVNSNVSRFLDFMSMTDHDTWFGHGAPWEIAHREWPSIKADLDRGMPSPIGLVAGSYTWPTNVAAKIGYLKNCHAVLAYGYDIDNANNLTLWVYDPDDPDEDGSTVSMSLGNPSHSSAISTPLITGSTGHSYRAFFRYGYYTPTLPPLGISPGPIAILVKPLSGNSIRAGKDTEQFIEARDSITGEPVDGAVWLGNVQIAETNKRFTFNCNAAYQKVSVINPETGAEELRWAGPQHPILSITAEGYERASIPLTLLEASPPAM
ncbi:hypothetical protein [Kitasatospora sp. Ki12]